MARKYPQYMAFYDLKNELTARNPTHNLTAFSGRLLDKFLTNGCPQSLGGAAMELMFFHEYRKGFTPESLPSPSALLFPLSTTPNCRPRAVLQSQCKNHEPRDATSSPYRQTCKP